MFAFTYFEDAPVFSLDSGPREGISFLGVVFTIISQRNVSQEVSQKIASHDFLARTLLPFHP